MKTNCLITGHNGFIGKAVCNRLAREDVGLIGFERDDVEKPGWEKNLADAVAQSKGIFHIGAISNTDASDVNETMFFNCHFTKVLFDLAAQNDVPVVYSSSASVYGNGNNIPRNLYAWTKKFGEDYGHARLKQFIALRYFNVYGPGESHKGSQASVAFQAYANRPNKFKLFPCRPRRDFVYIDDVVEATIKAMCFDGHHTFDVGTGESRPFEDVLDLLEVPYEYHDRSKIPEWYQFKTRADSTKFVTGWRPSFFLEDGIESYRKHLK